MKTEGFLKNCYYLNWLLLKSRHTATRPRYDRLGVTAGLTWKIDCVTLQHWLILRGHRELWTSWRVREKLQVHCQTLPKYDLSAQRINFQSESLTLYYNIRIGTDSVNIVAREAGVLSSISLIDTLNEKTAGRCNVDAGVHRQGRLVSFSPGYPGLWLTRRAALQGHTLPHQHLSILWLDHKTGPSWMEEDLLSVVRPQNRLLSDRQHDLT